MSRNVGDFIFPANFEVTKVEPLDGRQLVGTKADLTGTTTWNQSGAVWLYDGAIVSVGQDPVPENNGIYFLASASTYTDINSWVKAGTGEGGGTLNMSGSTVGGITTYVDATTICAQTGLTYVDGVLENKYSVDNFLVSRIKNSNTTGTTAAAAFQVCSCGGSAAILYAHGTGYSASIWGETRASSAMLYADSGTEKILIGGGNTSAPVKLFQNNSVKLSTTADGIDICGDLGICGNTKLCSGADRCFYFDDVTSTSTLENDLTLMGQRRINTGLEDAGGGVCIVAGTSYGTTSPTGGIANLVGGFGCTTTGGANGGVARVAGGNSQATGAGGAVGGTVGICGGNATTNGGGATGGNICLRAGTATGTGTLTDGSILLVHSGTAKLATKTDGINVTGKVCTDTIQISTGAASGCVLQSDASGNATWATPAGGGVSMSGSTINGLTTYVDADTICANQHLQWDDGSGKLILSGQTTGTRAIEIGQGRTDSGYAYIDLAGDATYNDWGLRILRSNTGENAESSICHRGTGNLRIGTNEAAPIVLETNNTNAVIIDTSQNVDFIGEITTPSLRANSTAGGSTPLVAESDTNGVAVASFNGYVAGTATQHTVLISNKGIGAGQYYGLYVDAYSTTAESEGRSTGVWGLAGNRTAGYNAGVVGQICGTNAGAGVLGTTGSIPFGYSGIWAGYFCGPVCATTYVSTPVACVSTIRADADVVNICSSNTNVLAIRDSDGVDPYMSWLCNEGTRIGYIRGCGTTPTTSKMVVCADGGGGLRIGTDSVTLLTTGTEIGFCATANGNSVMRHDNVSRIYTLSDGGCVAGQVKTCCVRASVGVGDAVICGSQTFNTTTGLGGVLGTTASAGCGWLGHYDGTVRAGVFGFCSSTTTYSTTTHAGYFCGCVCINNTLASGYALKVDHCGCAIDFVATSDCRMKKNITPISSALSTIDCLCGVCYDLCKNNSHDMGLIAQDVLKVEPRLVTTGDPSPEEKEDYGISDQILGLKYDKFAGLFVEAIKELKQQNECLQLQINELRKNK